ncbi:hypothetical protein JDN40_03930 [Rhodomicrobium vannielii ATCC 17100]|nr:hypothetical protein [Rhodomicrobium vannielii ATCC 17100]
MKLTLDKVEALRKAAGLPPTLTMQRHNAAMRLRALRWWRTVRKWKKRPSGQRGFLTLLEVWGAHIDAGAIIRGQRDADWRRESEWLPLETYPDIWAMQRAVAAVKSRLGLGFVRMFDDWRRSRRNGFS